MYACRPHPCRVPSLVLGLVLVAGLLVGPLATAHARVGRTRSLRGTSAHERVKRRYPRYRVRRNIVAGGHHWRLSTRRGRKVLHVWRPAAYHHRKAGIVLYVHGHQTSADKSWRRFRLAEQFRASRRNALFIVVDGPRRRTQRIKYGSLSEVLHLVAAGARIRLPRGRVVAVSHSSGTRTVLKWLRHRALDHVVILDGLFAGERYFARWVRKRRGRRLCLVARKTRSHCVRLARSFTRSATLARIPADRSSLTRRQRRARVLLIHSQYPHSAIVYKRKAIPAVLRLVGLRAVRPAPYTS